MCTRKYLEDCSVRQDYCSFSLQGYFRRGEVEFATGLFDHALESYRRASQLHNDPTLLECVLKANRELTRQQKVRFLLSLISMKSIERTFLFTSIAQSIEYLCLATDIFLNLVKLTQPFFALSIQEVWGLFMIMINYTMQNFNELKHLKIYYT